MPISRDAPFPQHAQRGEFSGPLQWLLEGTGWSVLRPTVDFVLMCVGVMIALGGLQATLDVPNVRAPLLLLPPIALLLLYLRGLYRTRLRALILDAVIPVVSAVSVAAMAVAMLGMFANSVVPGQDDWLKAWLFALLGLGLGRSLLALSQRLARSRRLVGKPVLIMGAGLVGSQVAQTARQPPRVRTGSSRFPRR